LARGTTILQNPTYRERQMMCSNCRVYSQRLSLLHSDSDADMGRGRVLGGVCSSFKILGKRGGVERKTILPGGKGVLVTSKRLFGGGGEKDLKDFATHNKTLDVTQLGDWGPEWERQGTRGNSASAKTHGGQPRGPLGRGCRGGWLGNREGTRGILLKAGIS